MESIRLAATLQWLHDHPGWLMIIDNIDSPEAAAGVKAMLARLYGGHVLLTGRVSRWSGGIEPIEIHSLDETAAVGFLLDRTARERHKSPTDTADAMSLAAALERMPLAMELAGASVANARISLGEYLQTWKSLSATTARWHAESGLRCSLAAAITCETTLAQLSPDEMAMLGLLSWCAPEPVPLYALEGKEAERIRRQATAMARRRFSFSRPSQEDARETLARLANLGLVRWSNELDAISVHSVVQEVLRARPEKAPPRQGRWIANVRSTWRRTEDEPPADSPTLALRLLSAATPGNVQDVRNWPKWEALRPHIAAAVAEADARSIIGQTAELMTQLGSPLCQRAAFHHAEPLLRRALAIDEASYGPRHANVARDLNNLASLLTATHRLTEAEPLMRRALEIDEACCGKGHPEVASDLNRLALLLEATSRLSEAEPMMRRALAIDEACYGKDHPNTAARLNNLAQLLQATNRMLDAEPLRRRALAIDEAVYGKNDARVATDLNNLAQILKATNRLSEAEPMMRRGLAIDETNFGKDHPEVATDLNNLAQLLKANHRMAEAEPLMRRVVRIFEANLGASHPNVAVALNNLAVLLQATGRLAEAEPLIRQALAIDESCYGKDHPEVATDLNNLARLLQAAHRLSEAEPLMRRTVSVFTSFTRRTGHEHPNLRPAISNHSALLRERGRSELEIDAEVKRLLEPPE